MYYLLLGWVFSTPCKNVSQTSFELCCHLLFPAPIVKRAHTTFTTSPTPAPHVPNLVFLKINMSVPTVAEPGGLSNRLPRRARRPIGRPYRYLGQIRESPILKLYMVTMTAAYQEIQQPDVWALLEGSRIFFKALHLTTRSIWSRARLRRAPLLSVILSFDVEKRVFWKERAFFAVFHVFFKKRRLRKFWIFKLLTE